MKVGKKVTWQEKKQKRTGEIFGYGGAEVVLVTTWDNGYAEIISVPIKRLAAVVPQPQQLRMEAV